MDETIWAETIASTKNIVAVKGGLRHLAAPGVEIAVRVSTQAARNAVSVDHGLLRIAVTAVPEGGKANAAVQKLLARSLGVPATRLSLICGRRCRDKLYRLD